MNKWDEVEADIDSGRDEEPYTWRRCMDNRTAAKVDKLKRRLLKDLADIGIYQDNHAKSGSVYLKFHLAGMGSLRISDHAGRDKYRFRWNLDLSRSGRTMIIDRGVERVFFGPDAYHELLAELRQNHKNRMENVSDDYDLWED